MFVVYVKEAFLENIERVIVCHQQSSRDVGRRVMKKIIILFCTVGLWVPYLHGVANAFRTLSEIGRGPFHYPLPPDSEKNWSIQPWSAGWGRTANQGFFNCNCMAQGKSDCDNCLLNNVSFPYNMNDNNTTFATAEGLTALWFGKSQFRGEEIFAGGKQLVPNNPWMSFATMAPRFVYSETAVFNGLIYTQKIDDSKWALEFRVMVPYRAIAVERKTCAEYAEILGPVIAEEVQVTDVAGGNPVLSDVSYAYRLDFLNSLQNNSMSTANPMVNFGTATSDTVVAGVDVALAGTPAVYMVKQSNGLPPVSPYAKAVGSAVPLPVDGSGTNYNTYQFSPAPADYADNLGTNDAAQGTLWAVPVVTGAVGSSALTPGATSIRNAVNSTLTVLAATHQDSAEAFFASKGIDFCTTSVSGVGDMELEINAIYTISDDAYMRIESGATIVTDKLRADLLTSMLFESLATAKRHSAVSIGLEGGWRPYDWFGFRINARYTYWFNRIESRAAPFKGATVVNIGCPIDVVVGFDWVDIHADATFFSPLNDNQGIDIGYELFAKSNERVRSNVTVANDLLGVSQPLDLSLLEKHTNSMAHRFRGQFFHRWNCVEVYGGFAEIFAGRHVMKETTWHVGIKMDF